MAPTPSERQRRRRPPLPVRPDPPALRAVVPAVGGDAPVAVADVDAGGDRRRRRDGRAGVDPPALGAVGGVDRVHRRVPPADVDGSLEDRRRRDDSVRRPEPPAFGPGFGVDRVHPALCRAGSGVHDALGDDGCGVDRAVRVEVPALGAVGGVEGVQAVAPRADVDGPVGHRGRRADGPAHLGRPQPHPVGRVEGVDPSPAADVDDAVDDRRRGTDGTVRPDAESFRGLGSVGVGRTGRPGVAGVPPVVLERRGAADGGIERLLAGGFLGAVAETACEGARAAGCQRQERSPAGRSSRGTHAVDLRFRGSVRFTYLLRPAGK